MVIGETEILGQVRQALEHSTARKPLDAPLLHVFRRALRVGRRARSETEIGRHAGSVPSVAIRLAHSTFPDIDRCRVLVIGAGDAARLSAAALNGVVKTDLSVANRSDERAEAFARSTGARIVPWDSLQEALMSTDIAITATNAPSYLLTAEDLERRAANGRPIVILDLAVPRDVDPAAGEVAGVHLYNVDDLQVLVDDGIARRRSESGKVHEIITEEVIRLDGWWRQQHAASTIRAVQQAAETLRRRELEKALRRMSLMNPEDEEILGEFSRSLTRKLLHNPTLALRNGDGTPERLEIARELFGVDRDGSDAPVEPVIDAIEETEGEGPR